MKLRIEKGNIKIRLTAAEIDQFHNDKYLNENIHISRNNHFSYSLRIDQESESCSAVFEKNSLLIHIPAKKAEKWINSNRVGIKETIITDNNDTLVLTLEEDLPPRKHKKKQ